MTTRADHPSNKLYRGEAQTFAQAMRLVEEQCEYEIRRGQVAEFDAHPERYTPLTSEERERYAREDAEMRASFEAYRDAARRAYRIHRAHMEAAERAAERAAVAEMRAAGDDNLNMIADALEADDYSGLAI